MNLPIKRKPLAFGLVFMALSMAIEIVLLVVVRLRIPQDNGIIAPILLIAAPISSACICGYRWPKEMLLVAFLTVVLTLVLVMGFGRVTGIGPPVILRTVAGFLAALLVNRVAKQRD